MLKSSLLLQNQGEEISLRLRTDDLKGFRKYESIKKTLLHELVSLFSLYVCILVIMCILEYISLAT